MGHIYTQLSLEERCTISRLHEDGQSIRQMAKTLDLQPSTIGRELRRNSLKTKGYMPAYASQMANARRWCGSRMERQPALRDAVLEHLAMGHSPEQTAGRLAKIHGKPLISYESIYRFIAAQIRRTNDGAWKHYLPQAKAKRGYRRRKHKTIGQLAGRVSIHDRPPAPRTEAGHWEADLMHFSTGTDAVVIAQERHSRLLVAALQPTKAAQPVCHFLQQIVAALPAVLRKTMTFDNGTEFSRHQQIALPTFFCDPHSPWQKGGVENAIGRLRRFLPRKTNPQTLTQEKILYEIQRYNHTPRKCLDFSTPAEVFLNQLLHFECESTPPIVL